MGLRTGDPVGLQSSGKGLGMAGSEAGRSWCSSCRCLQRETHSCLSERVTLGYLNNHGCHFGIIIMTTILFSPKK